MRDLVEEFSLTNVHEADRCQGQWCIIHKPLIPLENRVLVWRDDRGIFEQVCEHGVGHPVVEDETWKPDYELVHGCCGCCANRYLKENIGMVI